MPRRISADEMKRRQMVAQAKSTLTDAMGRVTEEVGELYYSEWLRVLGQIQASLVDDLLRDDWRGDEVDDDGLLSANGE